MTRHLASARCRELWYRLGLPFTRIRRKPTIDRCEVGYLSHGSNAVTVMGRGPSWEKAFERASKEST